ncbi:hypothetical protein KP509_22G032900 [Ceratopteris richardii]|nr:hypothetical protein KP509_22G032900 [Ceratopteris richardii]
MNERQASKAGSSVITPHTAQPTTPLRCPRCDSNNTKFCYYNNYSQTQPRHFCKSCRRYWTQGGTLRNVPVGGGCRKNKRVRPSRSLVAMAGLVDAGGAPFADAAASSCMMAGRLNSFPGFGSAICPSGGGGDPSVQPLQIAFARFHEALRAQQQSTHPSTDEELFSLSDAMSLPGLVQKSCGFSTCSAGTCGASHPSFNIEGCPNGRVTADAGGFVFPSLNGDARFCPQGFDITSNPLAYGNQNSRLHPMMGTSATATLASIEDELSSFSNLQYHADPFATDAISQKDQKEHKDLPSGSGNNAQQRLMQNPSALQLLHPGGPNEVPYAGESLQLKNSDLGGQFTTEDQDDDKPINRLNGESGLSLMMSASNWQHPPPSMESLYSPHQSMNWRDTGAVGRWQDMRSLASSAAAAGSVL